MLNSTHAQLLRLINQSGPLSRTELAALTGLSKASISGAMADLLSEGVVSESETVYGAGRPAIRLALNASSAFFAGVSLSPRAITLVMTDLHGNQLGRHRLRIKAGPAEVAEGIGDTFRDLVEKTGVELERVRAIGVSLPGLVNSRTGTCIRSTLLGWRDVEIAPLIGEATSLPAFVENDANALTLGEHLFGSLRGASCGALVSVGEGIGCGHILDGELYRGHRGGAGEIAHATIELNGQLCACGKRGCLDTIASLKAMARAAAQAGLPGNLTELEAAASDGEAGAGRILQQAGTALGLSISHIVQSLDPERVVIAFPDQVRDGLFCRLMRKTIEANVLPQSGDLPDIVATTIDRDGWARGASSVAANRSLFRRI